MLAHLIIAQAGAQAQVPAYGLVEVQAQAVAVQVGTEHDALLVAVVEAGVVARAVGGAAAQGQVVLLHGRGAQYLGLPVGAGSEAGYFGRRVVGGVAVVAGGLVGQLGGFAGPQQRVAVAYHLHAARGGVLHAQWLARRPAPGSDADNPILAQKTVLAGVERAFQNFDFLHVFGHDAQQRVGAAVGVGSCGWKRGLRGRAAKSVLKHRHAIDHVQRLRVAVEAGRPPDADYRPGPRRAGIGRVLHPRRPAEQGLNGTENGNAAAAADPDFARVAGSC